MQFAILLILQVEINQHGYQVVFAYKNPGRFSYTGNTTQDKDQNYSKGFLHKLTLYC